MIINSIAIVLTILSILLVSTNVIRIRWYALMVYMVGLASVYSTTLLGYSVVGTDISRELQMSNFALANGWNLSLLDPSNTSFVVGWLVPRFSEFFSIAPQWVYKIILPMIFACTPVLLYLIFKKQFGELRAFYASMFFIMMPVFSLEIATIGKSMVAETLMALCFWIMFTDWRMLRKFLLMLLVALLTLWAHYTVGALLICYLLCILLIMLAVKAFKGWKLWARKAVSLWVIAVVVVVSIVGFSVYYSNVSEGLVVKATLGIGNLYKVLAKTSILYKVPTTGNESEVSMDFEAGTLTQTKGTTPEVEGLTIEELLVAQYARQTKGTNPFISIGMGKDFIEASMAGKVFRIIQYLTQLLIVVGAIWLLLNYKRYTFQAEFIAGIVGSFIMLACCVFLPLFASLINMTRNYHVALFFLAPMFVLGVDALCNTSKAISGK